MSTYPSQKNTYAEKVYKEKGERFPKWCKQSIDYFIDQTSYEDSDRNEMVLLYKAAEGTLEKEHYKYVLNPYNTPESSLRNYPSKMRNYDIISPVIYSFLGEKSELPQNDQVIALNSDVKNKFTESLNDEMIALAKQEFINELNAQGVDTGQDSQEPTDFKKATAEFKNSYTDERAIKGQEALNYLKYDLDIKDRTQQGFYDWLVTGRVHTYKEIYRNNIKYYTISPLELHFSKSSQSDFLEDGNWVVRTTRMNINDIIDRFRDELTDTDITWLEEKRNTVNNSTNSYVHYRHEEEHNFSDSLLPVYHVCWKTFRKVGILKYVDSVGVEREKEVDDTYKLDKELGDIDIEWDWVDEVWEGWRIQEDLYIGGRPILVQRGEINNSSMCKLPYNGRMWFNKTKSVNSIVKQGLPYQALYNIYHYRMEMTMARNKDKIMMMPLGLVPKSFGKDAMDRFMYYAEATGIGWYDESAPNAAAAVQGMKVMDMGLAKYFGEMVQAMAGIKQEWWEQAGMNRQRYGDSKASDGKGTTEQAIYRSAIITKELFRRYEKFEEKDLNGLLDYSKLAWIDGKKGMYINGDGRKAFLNINGFDHMETEYSVFVKDNSKENDKLKLLKQYAHSFAQNGSKPGTIAELLDSDNYSQVKKYLSKMDSIMEQQQQQQDEANRASAEKIKQMEVEDSKQEREILQYKIDTDYKKAIDVQKLKNDITIESIITQSGLNPNEDNLNDLSRFQAHAKDRLDNAKLNFDRNIHSDNIAIKRQEIESKERIAKENKNRFDTKKK